MSFPAFDTDGMTRIDADQTESLIALCTTPDHIKAIVRAMRDYGIGWIFVPQTDQPIDKQALSTGKGYIAVISDDTDCAMGPIAFDAASLKGLIKSAASVAVISCDFIASVYELLSTMSGLLQAGTVVIETRPEMEETWLSYIRSVSQTVPIILCTPKDRGGAA